MPGTVTLEYFAWVREQIGRSQETLALAAPATVAGVLDMLVARSEPHTTTLAQHDRLRFAVNQTYVAATHVVQPGDTLAIFPPVTGG